MNFNQPLSSESEEQAQKEIDSILGGFKPSQPVEANPVDTS